MLDIGTIKRDVPQHFMVPNMLLLAGASQNVGKTSFAIGIIRKLKNEGHKVYGLKITPHFHKDKPDHLIVQTDEYQIAIEKSLTGKKDSSKMLLAGAEEVFFVQIKSDFYLPEVFDTINRMTEKEVLWVCESGGLRNFVQPGLFLYLKLKDQVPEKMSAKKLMPLADLIVNFDGLDFDLSFDNIVVVQNNFRFI